MSIILLFSHGVRRRRSPKHFSLPSKTSPSKTSFSTIQPPKTLKIFTTVKILTMESLEEKLIPFQIVFRHRIIVFMSKLRALVGIFAIMMVGVRFVVRVIIVKMVCGRSFVRRG